MFENISGKMVTFLGFAIGLINEVMTLFGQKFTAEAFYIVFVLVLLGLLMIKIEEIRDELRKLNELNTQNDKTNNLTSAEMPS